ncbi:DUF302 domain-containing protein [Candidatus Pacearchaeota archaeon]|nr:DUF302 domain-containing protein [Candidatus Pacearchaeota archaeon]
MAYGYSKVIDIEFEQAEEVVRKALYEHGFGVMTKGDVKLALKKAGFEFDDYIILGACYPELAYKALKVEPEIGLLLPCNVIIYKKQGKTIVSAINPIEAMGMVENEKLTEIASIVKEKLESVIDSIK